MHVSGPEVSPAAWANEIVSGLLNQPLPFGALLVAAFAVGGVAS